MKLLFIASAQLGQNPTGGGVQVKNQNLIEFLRKDPKVSLEIVDTWGRKGIASLLASVKAILGSSQDTVVIFSIARRGVLSIIKIMSLLCIRRKMIFLVPGGDIYKEISESTLKLLRRIDKILVQADYLRTAYMNFGLDNVEVLHNFKNIKYLPATSISKDGKLHLVFLGRIIKQKGIEEIMASFSGFDPGSVTVDFYGKLVDYDESFFEHYSDCGVSYKGFLDLQDSQGYELLASYDALLFPTYFEGEGFPGVLIDGFIAGLPAIVTDYHANPEIIQNGYNGIVIPVKNVAALSEAIRKLTDKVFLEQLSQNARSSASKYSTEVVLSKLLRYV